MKNSIFFVDHDEVEPGLCIDLGNAWIRGENEATSLAEAKRLAATMNLLHAVPLALGGYERLQTGVFLLAAAGGGRAGDRRNQTPYRSRRHLGQ